MATKSPLIWGYVIEAIIAVAIYVFTRLFITADVLTAFIHDTLTEWDKLTGALFSASLAVFIVFVNLGGSNFGAYLRAKRCDGTYSFAFRFAIIVFFVATVLLICAKGTSSTYVAHAAYISLVYALINAITLIQNAAELASMHGVFRDEEQKQNGMR